MNESPVFYYRIVPHNGGAVFAAKDRAVQIAQVHNAIRSANTWSEFRSLVPAGEYVRVLESIEDCGGEHPSPDTPFESGMIPGFNDGDYPPWLQREMDDLLPMETLRQFGVREQTYLGDSFWLISPESAEALAEQLRSKGAIVIYMQALAFH